MRTSGIQLTFALNQLDDAIELFLDKQSYASALTLAGAAEEIFGKALEHSGQENVLTWQYEMSEKMAGMFDDLHPTKKEFAQEQNEVRNYLKHFFSEEHEFYDIQDAAVKMIIRAQENASRLNLEVARVNEFEQWFLENVVG